MHEGAPQIENSEAENNSAEETIQEEPNQELNPESIEARREKIIEGAQENRLKLFTGNLLESARKLNDKPGFQNALNKLQALPVIGALPVAFKMAINRENGEALSNRQRVMYGAGLAVEGLAAIMMLSGEYKQGMEIHTASDIFIKPQALLDIAKSVSKTVGNYLPALGNVMEASCDWIGNQTTEQIEGLEAMLQSSLINLDLQNFEGSETHG